MFIVRLLVIISNRWTPCIFEASLGSSCTYWQTSTPCFPSVYTIDAIKILTSSHLLWWIECFILFCTWWISLCNLFRLRFPFLLLSSTVSYLSNCVFIWKKVYIFFFKGNKIVYNILTEFYNSSYNYKWLNN